MFSEHIQVLAKHSTFNIKDFYQVLRDNGFDAGDESLRKKLHEMLNAGAIVRVGRNTYCVPGQDVRRYEYTYSDTSNDVARTIIEKYPYIDFILFELLQLNEFVNHQLAHNTIFVSVESDIMDFVFDTLKEAYTGKVLLNPSVEVFHQYWVDNMIVIMKMITETPRGIKQKWHARIENILVDLMSVPLLQESISESEYEAVFENAFTRYVVNESCLFRYARRRAAEKRIKRFIKEKTGIILKTEQ